MPASSSVDSSDEAQSNSESGVGSATSLMSGLSSSSAARAAKQVKHELLPSRKKGSVASSSSSSRGGLSRLVNTPRRSPDPRLTASPILSCIGPSSSKKIKKVLLTFIAAILGFYLFL